MATETVMPHERTSVLGIEYDEMLITSAVDGTPRKVTAFFRVLTQGTRSVELHDDWTGRREEHPIRSVVRAHVEETPHITVTDVCEMDGTVLSIDDIQRHLIEQQLVRDLDPTEPAYYRQIDAASGEEVAI